MDICKRCGQPLEVTQIIQGKIRTHPCACQCMINSFECGLKRKNSKRFEEMQQEVTTYGKRAENQGLQQGGSADGCRNTG